MKSKQKQRRAQVRRQKAKAKRNAQRSKNPARGSAGIELPSGASSVSPGSRGVEGFPIPFDHRSLERALATFAPGPDDDDLSAAQDIMYEAFDAREARTRVELAREAVSVSRDCADAYVLLAEEAATSLEEALSLYAQGVAAGERALGEEAFEADVGHFWGLFETRPYMRARFGLAQCLLALGRTDEAREHMEDLLRLNPSDNQGVRDILGSILATAGIDDALQELLDRYEDDSSAAWAWTRVLVAARRSASPEEIGTLVDAARRSNPHVPDYLLGRRRIPEASPAYIELGGESEAAAYAASYGRAWASSPAALRQLEQLAR